jgi:Holliday junction resolvase-like predicted endonuclease
MITENDVIDLLCSYLRQEGYEIVQCLNTGQKGVDVIAKKAKLTYYVEAKGETSSKQHTNRYGKAFSANQIKSHVSRAVLSAMTILNSQPASHHTRAAVALPDTTGHRTLIKTIAKPLTDLGILVFWVSQESVQRQ